MLNFNNERQFTKGQLTKAKQLRDQANKKLATMEYRTVTLKRVSNLSHADVAEIADAMDRLVSTGQDPYAYRMDPSTDIETVYKNAGVF